MRVLRDCVNEERVLIESYQSDVRFSVIKSVTAAMSHGTG